MNKLLKFTLLICFFTALSSRVSAISSISLSIRDSITTYCVIPNKAAVYVTSGYTGSLTPADTFYYEVDFGDGTDTTFFYGSGIIGFLKIEHTYLSAGSYTTRYIVHTNSGFRDTTYGTGFTLFNSCGTVKGNLFIDSNSNCIKDPFESNMYLTPLVAINTLTLDTITAGWSDYSGNYNLTLSPGNYNILPNYRYASPGLESANPFINPSCPATGMYTVSVSSGAVYTQDFAYSCGSPLSYDAKALVSGGCFSPGDSSVVYIWGGVSDWYYFYSCIITGVSSSITVTLDPKISYLGYYYGAVPTVSGSTLTYSLSKLSDLSRFYSGIYVKTDTTATIGDTINISAHMAPIAGITDPNLSNNTHLYKKAVVSSYDPNIKEVMPKGFGEQGFIKSNEDLTYTIHFQNTGTAAAKKVVIVDEIDSNLKLESLHILGSTHNLSFSRIENKVRFTFNNINLPDSGSNYFGSMGSVTYSIKQKKDLAPGKKMENTAAIFFDYNPPIITNTTLNTIIIPTNVENVTIGNDIATVFPNPANNSLSIKMENTKQFTVNVIDLLGRAVLKQSTSNGELIINTSSFPSGLYIATIIDNNGNKSSNKVQIKH